MVGRKKIFPLNTLTNSLTDLYLIEAYKQF